MPEFPLDYKLLRAQIMSCLPLVLSKVPDIDSKLKSLSRVQLSVIPWTIQSVAFSRPEYWSRWPFPSPGDLPKSGIKSQADSLPAEPPEKPKNTEVGSLSLLQQIFQTQESNRGLLHCRQILYQLSYEGSLTLIIKVHKCLWANWT